MEGGLKFDPVTGGLVAAGSFSHDHDTGKVLQHGLGYNLTPQRILSVPCVELSAIKLENNDCVMVGSQFGSGQDIPFQNIGQGSLHTSQFPSVSFSDGEKSNDMDVIPNNSPSNRQGLRFGSLESRFLSRNSSSVGEGNTENQPASSSMTDTSNGSLMNGSSSSSPSHDYIKARKKVIASDSGSKITVKATFLEDTIRFKFEPSSGCYQLYEEVAKRFKLQVGTFKLKYLDDEDELVVLESELDWQECLEVIESVGTPSVKFIVLEIPCVMGSSGSSNCFLARGS